MFVFAAFTVLLLITVWYDKISMYFAKYLSSDSIQCCHCSDNT